MTTIDLTKELKETVEEKGLNSVLENGLKKKISIVDNVAVELEVYFDIIEKGNAAYVYLAECIFNLDEDEIIETANEILLKKYAEEMEIEEDSEEYEELKDRIRIDVNSAFEAMKRLDETGIDAGPWEIEASLLEVRNGRIREIEDIEISLPVDENMTVSYISDAELEKLQKEIPQLEKKKIKGAKRQL